MENYELVTINGLRYRLVPEKDCIQKQKTGYEKICGQKYWCSTMSSPKITSVFDDMYTWDTHKYKIGNYYNDQQLAIDNDRADEIFRRMRQWQALNDEAVDIYNPDIPRYMIAFNIDTKTLYARRDSQVYIHNHTIYFSTYDKATEALTIFYNDLTWLHTKYRRRLDEHTRN